MNIIVSLLMVGYVLASGVLSNSSTMEQRQIGSINAAPSSTTAITNVAEMDSKKK